MPDGPLAASPSGAPFIRLDFLDALRGFAALSDSLDARRGEPGLTGHFYILFPLVL